MHTYQQIESAGLIQRFVDPGFKGATPVFIEGSRLKKKHYTPKLPFRIVCWWRFLVLDDTIDTAKQRIQVRLSRSSRSYGGDHAEESHIGYAGNHGVSRSN